MTGDWEDAMSVGVEAIDAHHRQLRRRLRHLDRAVAGGREGEVRGALRFLHDSLAEHHVEEERWMAEAGYPGALEHARDHAAILRRVREAGEGAGPGEAGSGLEAAAWVARALEAHMRRHDLRLGRFFTARENLRRLAEAGPGVGASLTPIPGMLAAVSPARDEDPAPGRRGDHAGPGAPRGGR